jgi:hypothetical protein
VALLDFAQAEAYARRFPFLQAVTLPRGLVDLAADSPPRDIHLLATTATLLVHEDLHPALQQLRLQSAVQGVQQFGAADKGWGGHVGDSANPG